MNVSIKRKLRWGVIIGVVAILAILVAGCAGPAGEAGPPGAQGPSGASGTQGAQGSPGEPAALTPTFALKFDADKPGCGGVCHEVVSQAPHLQPNVEGKYTLAYEAKHADAEAHDFDPLGELKTLNDCLECHAVGTGDREGMGNIASKSLRETVHKVHLSSPHFEAAQLEPEVLEEGERPGDCFTCHVVSGPSTIGLYE